MGRVDVVVVRPWHRRTDWLGDVHDKGLPGSVLQATRAGKLRREVLAEIKRIGPISPKDLFQSHSLVDRVDISQVVFQRKDAIYFFARQILLNIGVGFYQLAEITILVPNSHRVALDQLVSLFA